MADNLSQHLRIIPSQRLDDRFLTAQRLVSEDKDKQNMGEIYAVVEITRPWLTVSQIGSKIVNTFKKAYYEGDSSSDLVNFEKAVKQVNEMLLNLTEQGETDWIGHLNAVIGILIDREIHITSAGIAQAYLFRDGKVSHITEKRRSNEPHPLKTFGSIISGTLLVDDAILITSSSLMDTISLTVLKTYFDETDLVDTGNLLLKHIKRSHIKTTGSVILKLTSQALGNQDAPEVLYTDQSFKANSQALKEIWLKNMLPSLIMLGAKLTLFGQNLKNTTKTKVIPATSKITKDTLTKVNQNAKKTWDKTKPALDEQGKKFAHHFDSALTGIKDTKKDTSHFNDDSAESIIGKSIFTINDYQETAQKQADTKLTKIWKKTINLTQLAWKNSKKHIRTLGQPKNRPLLFTLIGIFLVVCLIASIAIQRHNKNLQLTTSDQKKTLAAASDKLSQGQIALSNGQNSKAQVDFGEALKLAQSLDNTPLESQASYIIKTSSNEFDKLTGTTRLDSLAAITKINGSHLRIIKNKVYTINSAGEIFETGLVDNSISLKVATLPNDDKAVMSTINSTNDTLLIETQKKNLYEYQPTDKKLTKIKSADSSFEPSVDQAVFNDTTYLLDPTNNQIWKYAINSGQTNSKSAYITDGTSLNNSLSLAIDGSVYVLFKNGQVDEFTKGQKQEFKLDSIPEPFDQIKGALQIYTDPDTTSIYILDKADKRIIEFDKNGQFTHQYILPNNFKDIKSFIVQPKGHNAYVVNKDQIYQINL